MAVMAELERRTDLSDLARKRREQLGLSLREVEERSADPTTGEVRVKFGWYNKLEKADSSQLAPTYVQLEGLAAALDLPLQAIQDHAAAQWLGIEPKDVVWSSTAEARIVVARMDELSEAERKDLVEFVDLFLRRRNSPDTNAT
jgi:transcriptional regulator with XRE-family HTH domain